jgi:hypothetical protein
MSRVAGGRGRAVAGARRPVLHTRDCVHVAVSEVRDAIVSLVRDAAVPPVREAMQAVRVAVRSVADARVPQVAHAVVAAVLEARVVKLAIVSTAVERAVLAENDEGRPIVVRVRGRRLRASTTLTSTRSTAPV